MILLYTIWCGALMIIITAMQTKPLLRPTIVRVCAVQIELIICVFKRFFCSCLMAPRPLWARGWSPCKPVHHQLLCLFDELHWASWTQLYSRLFTLSLIGLLHLSGLRWFLCKSTYTDTQVSGRSFHEHNNVTLFYIPCSSSSSSALCEEKGQGT